MLQEVYGMWVSGTHKALLDAKTSGIVLGQLREKDRFLTPLSCFIHVQKIKYPCILAFEEGVAGIVGQEYFPSISCRRKATN